jgi:CubicO group peptidase (beta-lactamase class C family)
MRALPLILALIASPSAAFADGPSRASMREEEVDPGRVGMDARRLAAVDRLIQEAIRRQVTPGAAIAIGRHGQLVRLRGYGRIDYRADAPRVTESTIYDIASLTKAVGTTSAAMMLVQDGRLDLDRPLVQYFPEWTGSADRAWMTARHLLTHTSGLPAGGPLSGVVAREDIVGFMADVRLKARPGARYEYSDYGLILLGSLIERITGERLDAFLQRELFDPLQLQDTGFNPKRWAADESSPFHLASAAAPVSARIAPTERTPRRGVIRGEVHDPLAYRLDGVAGNAGIFSSARDLAVFAKLVLSGGALGDTRIFADTVIHEFTRRRSPLARHALGWELAREDGPSGDLFPATAFGHTGFTGTSLFVDPEHDLFVVLLTNRVYPNASERRHIALRKAVHDAVIKAILE